MMKKNKKQLEKNRWSLLTKNLDYCVECGRIRDDLHEVYEGAYRLRSMEFGCVIPLCRSCHNRIHRDTSFKLKYKRMFEKLFNEHYPDLNFHDYFYYKDVLRDKTTK